MAGPWENYAPVSDATGPWSKYAFSLPSMKDVVDTSKGLAKAADAGVASGVATIGGALGDLTNLGATGIEKATNYVERKIGLPESKRSEKDALSWLPTSESMSKEIQSKYYGGEKPYEPQNFAEKVAKSAGEFVPGAFAGPGALLTKLGKFALTPAIASEGAKVAAEGTGYEGAAGMAGALLGPFIPGAVRRGITPFPASAERQALVNTLNNEGVTSLTAGQMTGSRPLRYAESVLGDTPFAGAGATRIQNEGQRQFNEAALRRGGINAEAATPDVLAANQRRLSQSFEDLSARNTAQFDQQFATDIRDTVRDHSRLLDAHQKQVVHDIVQDIAQYGQAMPGDVYQATRSLLSKQANSVRQSHPPFAEALRGIRNALDDVMERSVSTVDRDTWQATRQQYGAQKVLEKTASRAGEATAEGAVVPANLRNTVAADNRGQYSRGEGPFGELARAGTAVMAPLPNSGTPARLAAMNMLALPGAVAGGPVGWGAAVAGALTPALVGRALMSGPVQRYLSNQTGPQQIANRFGVGGRNPVAGNPRIAAIVDALMAQNEAPR